MDIERAKELLSAPDDGVDPLTGEVLDRDNVCNRPEIIRALHTVLYELEKPAVRPGKISERKEFKQIWYNK